MKDKVVIITGGSSGIGKACAEVFGREGAKVVITGRNEQTLIQEAVLLKQAGIEVLPIVADVSIEKDNEKVVSETVSKYGKIDVLINNAGISMHAMFEELDLNVIKKVMDINFYGTVYATKYALPYLLKTKGSIVAVSSIAGKRGLPVRVGYSASKFAVEGFMEGLRTELMKTGVHVLVACPGFTASNIRNTALSKNGASLGESFRDEGKMMSAEAVAMEIVKAVKKRKRTILLTTQGKLVVFLNKWLPKLADKIVYNTLAKEKDSPLAK